MTCREVETLLDARLDDELDVTGVIAVDQHLSECRVCYGQYTALQRLHEEIAAADFVLSILPPGDALALAQRFAPVLAATNAKPVYVDCNAINPATVVKVAGAIAPTGCAFVDAGIIGPPPKGDDAGPRLYASGTEAARFASLRQYGLDLRVLEGPLSAASALKMSYAGINKGTQARRLAVIL